MTHKTMQIQRALEDILVQVVEVSWALYFVIHIFALRSLDQTKLCWVIVYSVYTIL